jgi:tetratricopeptide (TPR) repeat protein
MKQLLFSLFAIASITVNAQSASEFYANAKKYVDKENYTEAAKLLTQAYQLAPENDTYLRELAQTNYLRRAYFEAIPQYEKIVQTDNENVEALTILSEMYSMSPQKQKAIQYAENALEVKPTSGLQYKRIARTYYEVKHFPKAIKYYQEAEKFLPNEADIPFKIAGCYAQISAYNDAMRYYQRTIELDPENATKLYEAANNAANAGNGTRALELYQLAEDKGYFRTSSFYDNWASTCTDMKDYNKALFYYSKAKEFAPYDREINLSMAEVYTKKGDFVRSREILDGLLEINPNDAEVIYTKGMTFYKAGHTNKAEVYFNQAFIIDPSLKSLRYTKSNL